MTPCAQRTARCIAAASWLLGVTWLAGGCVERSLPQSATQPPVPRKSSSVELFERGSTFARAGDSARAEQYMTLAVEQGYPAERAIRPLLHTCLREGRLKAALDHATAFLERHPNDVRLRMLVAALESALGHPSLALRELERVLAEQPTLALAHYQLGVLLLETFGDATHAKRCFRRYLEHDRDGPFAEQALAYLTQPERAARAHSHLRGRIAFADRGAP